MKEAYYFPHDYNAKSDQKMLILRGEYGLEGYALFFMILEDMAQETNGYLNRVAIGGLSIGYGIPKEKTTEIINFCIEIGLFYEDDSGIYSKRMLEHKNFRKGLSKAGKEGADKRWKNRVANGGANSTPNAKERKGKEKKINNIEYILDSDDFIKQRGLDILEEFVNHRSETDSNGKQKRQKQKTWDTKKRLFTWKKNKDTNFGRKVILDYEILDNFHKGAMADKWDDIKQYFRDKYKEEELRKKKYWDTKTKRKNDPLFLEALK